MKGFQLGLKPELHLRPFLHQMGRARPRSRRPGRSSGAVTLEEELIETPENGVATIMADEFFNVSTTAPGAGQMNFQP